MGAGIELRMNDMRSSQTDLGDEMNKKHDYNRNSKEEREDK